MTSKSKDKLTKLWNPVTGTFFNTSTIHIFDGFIRAIALSKDGHLMAPTFFSEKKKHDCGV